MDWDTGLKKRRPDLVRILFLKILLISVGTLLVSVAATHFLMSNLHFKRDKKIAENWKKQVEVELASGSKIIEATQKVAEQKKQAVGFDVLLFDGSGTEVFSSTRFWDRKIISVLESNHDGKSVWRETGAIKNDIDNYTLIHLFDFHPVQIKNMGKVSLYNLHTQPIFAILIFLVMAYLGIAISFLFTYRYVSSEVNKHAERGQDILQQFQQGNLALQTEIKNGGALGAVEKSFNDMAQELEKAMNRIRESEARLRETLQEITHDLKTPISSMSTMIDTLLVYGSQISQDEMKAKLQTMNREMGYFKRLIEDLLFLSGLVTRKKSSEDDHNLVDIIHELGELVNESGLEFEVTSITDISYRGNPFLVRRMLRNLIENAAGFAKSNIYINLEKVDNCAVIQIRDDGPGLSEESLKNFGKKQQTRYITKSPSADISLGLGSVIALRIVQKLSGNLTIGNHLEGGALVTISLPLDIS